MKLWLYGMMFYYCFMAQWRKISELHHILESTINSLAVLFNLILLYLIRRHSTSMMPTYMLLLTVDASLDLALATVGLLVQPVYIIGEGNLISVARGPLAVLYRPLTMYLIVTFCLVFLLNLIWVPAQFAARCIVMCYIQRKKVLLRLVPIAVVIWSAFGLAAIIPVYRPSPEFQAIGTRVLHNMGWPVEPNGTEPVLGAPLDDTRQLTYVGMWMMSSTIGTSIVIASELKIVRFLRSFNNTYTEQTRQMHKEFHRALLAMAICPLVTTSGPTFYFVICMALSLEPGMASVFVSTAFASIALLNPLTTMLFMRSYREVVWKALCGRVIKPKVAPSHAYDVSTTVPSAPEA